mmetsp:Transcript_28110/g.76258  ORF Transcript_28110/g.76258 Transcript_28110/m.76258 type:complete len:209 (-) Transcript_28110:222-848(-)|eukprot:CAMPEP_0172370626 /NCGR_PEP_ID=MMETSP1060-20121228/38658_1 /TAXON_ID=37318 /ORGANISM="Pseudo-nitzschia pungens, Strain cf. cingulata" /LENGTH=208 /DNA_ID=CAMNT_0013095955 /DNA_START=46 /DNA_END=672 /DNA_ORIENTATION=+
MNSVTKISMLLVALAIAFQLPSSQAFHYSTRQTKRTRLSATVIDAPTKEDLDRKVGRRSSRRGNDNDDLLGDAEENIEEALRKQGPLEYLEDNPDESRDMKDPFHIIILDQTFEKPKITIPYVASNLEYVLGMPLDDATDHSQWCYDNGLSCVGVWPREECLSLGRQLQLRDIVCRVVPFAEGGHRAWQADKDAKDATYDVDTSRFLE